MCQEQLLAVSEVSLDEDRLVVAILFKKGGDELLSPRLVRLDVLVGWNFESDLVPHIHELFQLS